MALVEKLGPLLEIDDVQLLMDAAQTALRLESGEGFSAHPVVSLRNRQPLVDCVWMGMLAQITPEQARVIGLGLIRTATEAESDVAIFEFLKETGISDEKAAAAVGMVRSLRQKFESVVGEKQEVSGPDISNVTPFGKPS